MILDDCEMIFDRAISSKSESEFRDAIEPLWREYPIMSLDMGRGSIFWRARLVENEIFPNLSNLAYPPPEVAKQGRMNDVGAPCFYISARKETALAEIGAMDGQLIQLAGFRVTNESPIRLAVIGEYANVYKNGYMHFAGHDPDMAISKLLNAMPRNEALKKLYIDKFFASVLADPDAAATGYVFSRALAKSVYSRILADGIVFPSVKDRGGFNVSVQAEPSDRKFHNVCCLVVRIEKVRRYGLIEFSIVKSADRLDDNLNFVWKTSSDGETIGLYNLSKEEFEAGIRHDDPRNALLNMLHMNSKQR
jgi:hypothetical protein